MMSNRFFSAIVRIQKERGHTVVTTGPYRIVRHPGYLGAILHSFALPLLLGSVWGLMPAAVVVVGILVRTIVEDRVLRAQLEGYPEYARRVRFRLLPGVW
jgi:protein-S-isoprenylcysteine O-methyltransferase Ste14